MATISTEQITTSSVDSGLAPAATPAATPISTAATPVSAGRIEAPLSANQPGLGTDGEFDVWEAGYAMRAFAGRMLVLGLFTLAWVVLAIRTWGQGHRYWTPLAIIFGIVVGIAWLLLLRRMAAAWLGHHYRLTDRRLFVSTGFLSRRRDQIELLRVQDVYTRQSLAQRWLSVGTVIVVSSEPHFPLIHLAGVSEPKAVMDLIWHHARKERDRRSVKVDEL